MRVYIAGPMTGMPDYNYPAFNRAATDLLSFGHEPVNPARRGVVEGWSWSDYLRPAIRDLTTCDGVVLLPGWEASRGATLEAHIATALGIQRVTVG